MSRFFKVQQWAINRFIKPFCSYFASQESSIGKEKRSVIKWFVKPFGSFFAIWSFISISYQFFTFTANSWCPELLNSIENAFPASKVLGKFMSLLDVHFGILAGLLGFVALSYVALKEADLPFFISEINKSANLLQGSSKEVKKYAQDNASQALKIVERLLNIKLFSEERGQNHLESSTAAMAAIACNLGNWEKHVVGTTENPKCAIITEVWLRSQSAYYLEEGYEIGKKSMATNGRNFCFLLLATLDAFIQEAGAGKKVFYTAVTPVSPEDWYNWPHGYGAGGKHYENEFIGDYHRILREYLKSTSFGSDSGGASLVHTRYILVTNKDKKEAAESNSREFGWGLLGKQKFIEHVNGWIVPVSIPLKDINFHNFRGLKEAVYGVGLKEFFIDQRHIGEKNQDDEINYVTPLFTKSWTYEHDGKKVNNDLVTAPDSSTVCRFVEFSKSHHEKEVATYASLLLGKMDEYTPSLYRDVEMFCANVNELMISKDSSKVVEWLRQSHNLEAQLAAESPDKAESLHKLRKHLLRFRDSIHFNHNGQAAPSIAQVFAEQLHTDKSCCKVVTLSSELVSKMKKEGIKQEFHLFACCDKDQNEPFANDWKLIITTSLDYPFEVTRITLHDDPDKDKFKSYASLLEEFDKKDLDGSSKVQPILTILNV